MTLSPEFVCLQNAVLVSIPSVADPSMAPPGKHSLHAYLPATEPFELWKSGLLRTPSVPHTNRRAVTPGHTLLWLQAEIPPG